MSKGGLHKGLKRPRESEEGVLKLMQQPHVLEAVQIVLEMAKDAPLPEVESPLAAEPEPEAVEAPPPPKPPPGPAKLPAIEDMHAAGYQGSLQAMRATWSWAKDFGRDHVVWPTPTSGMQEALRFDAHGWPHSQTTPAEWIDMLTYWSVLREQMACGASRTQRNAVDLAYRQFEGSRRS